MSQIIHFPVSNNQRSHDYDSDIDEALASIPSKDREKLRFELIKTIDGYDAFFTQWSLSLPDDSDETLKKQIYDLAHQEHGRKVRMLKDIMMLKAKVLVAEYRKHR
ncbi:hypothetical protein J5J83_18705 [Azoarcus sp. L1K30]|uniref:hypothetical protein n=1 Tax=Azoarcus sp. L1K30 TaxID=2820277 RepID=UPI001B81146E|nr:hypothetical protein [Azoarcus sp. L1K30]MBR0568155.1 hypothetical protein [Azoarcus sp. L1K30]